MFRLSFGSVLVFALCACRFGMAAADFAPYQVILDREIFGRPPPAPVAPPADASAPDRAVELLAKKVTMCAVNRTPSGNTAVGFIDNDAKPPRNIYLNVGESADGYRIVAADYDEETATIEKDGVTVTLKLGKGLVTTPVAAAGSPLPVVGMSARARGPVGGRMPAPLLTKLQQPGTRSGSPMAQSEEPKATNEPSYREQLQKRTVEEQEQERLAREAQDKVAREKFEELARQITAEEVRKQVLAAEQAWEGAEVAGEADEGDEGDDAWTE